MQAVIETPSYLSAADDAGMTDEERRDAVTFIAANPMAGDMIQGTGGCRKVRLAGRGKGKSGGYRIITYYAGTDVPVFLLTVFSKGERANLTKAEKNSLRTLTQTLVASLTAKVVRLGKKGA